MAKITTPNSGPNPAQKMPPAITTPSSGTEVVPIVGGVLTIIFLAAGSVIALHN